MSPQINCDQATKNEFQALMPDYCDTQAEFLAELLSVYRAAGTANIDVETFLEKLERKIASNAEVGAYRGINEAINEDADEEPRLEDVREAALEVLEDG